MERYTYFEGGKWRLRVGDTEYSGPWVDRIAAYEDTELEPEKIEQLKGEVFGLRVDKAVLNTYQALGTIKDLFALVKAREDGPCGLCRFNPPSSCDGKPCTMCPAAGKDRAEAEAALSGGVGALENQS